MSPKKSRKKYDIEFKQRAVRLSPMRERIIKEVADSLGIHELLLYRWRQQFTPEGEKTQLAEMQDEASILRQPIAESEENYILKTLAFFAKHQK